MDPASSATSVDDLAALFERCLRSYKLFQQRKDFWQLSIFSIRLNGQKRLFKYWGGTVGLPSAGRSITLDLKKDTRMARLIQRHLECIWMILEDADQLRSKYEVTKTKPQGPQDPISESALNPFWSPLPLPRFVRWFQERISDQIQGKWTPQDQKKSTIILRDLDTLLRQLQETTFAIAEVQRQLDCWSKISRISKVLGQRLATKIQLSLAGVRERQMARTEAAISVQENELQRRDYSSEITAMKRPSFGIVVSQPKYH